MCVLVCMYVGVHVCWCATVRLCVCVGVHVCWCVTVHGVFCVVDLYQVQNIYNSVISLYITYIISLVGDFTEVYRWRSQ